MRFKIFMLFFAIFCLLLTALLATAQYDPTVGTQDNVFLLTGDRQAHMGPDFTVRTGDHGIVAVVIIPYDVRTEIIEAAWSYAVQYSADGLSLPNYQAAVELLMERHPTWIAAVTDGWKINFNPESVLTDVPDPTLTPNPETTANP